MSSNSSASSINKQRNNSLTSSNSYHHHHHPNTSTFTGPPLKSFEFLFSEIIRYTQSRVDGIQEFEKKLTILGYHIGIRLLSLINIRESLVPNLNSIQSNQSTSQRSSTILSNSLTIQTNHLPPRLNTLVPVLSWIHTTLWKNVVGKTADVLEHSNDNDDEYMISDNCLLLTKSITIPKEMSQLSCGAIMAGVVEASLDGLGFPARVTSHSAPSNEFPNRTTLLIKFEKESMQRGHENR
ncbi:NO signaling/Golgi transport ligand-binding domain-containing protein [Melampsora americana]|nr:NO signaling/Golgi transport ligand-binding domain-containing protein [Melampsora americana]